MTEIKNEDLHKNQDIEVNNELENQNVQNPSPTIKEENNNQVQETKKKDREFKINSGNVAILASSLSLILSAVNKLLRMLVFISGGLIIFLYILSALLSFFALFSCIKYAMKEKTISVDSYFCGISILVLILI